MPGDRTRPRAAAARRGSLVLLVLLPLLLLLSLLGPGGPLPGAGSAHAAVPPVPAAGTPGGPLVLAGVSGLRWEDVSADRTPQLWQLAGESDLASVSVRATEAVTCPGDGWLTVSAGRRALQGEEPEGVLCPTLPAVSAQGAVEGWPGILEANRAQDYGAEPGLLASALPDDACALAVGPGAALALADPGGRVAAYLPEIGDLDAEAAARCPLLVVDLGTVVEPGLTGQSAQSRPEQVARVDRRLGALAEVLPTTARVLLTGLGASGSTAHLAPMAWTGPDPGQPTRRWLESPSTQRTGLVQLTDVLPTVVEALGGEPPRRAIGSAVRPGPPRPPLEQAVERLADADTAAVVSASLLPPFTVFLVLSQVLLYAAAAAAVRWGRREVVLRLTRAGAVACAALPVSTYAAMAAPWWRADRPALVLLVLVAGWATALTAVALTGPWRRHVLGPLVAVAGTTAAVLAVDVATGSRLQLNALLGYSPLVAGRFYGFGNIAFALWATSLLLALAAAAAPLVRAGRRRAATVTVAAVGVPAVLLTGLDRLGTDFGGVIALTPGLAVLAMALAGARPTPGRLAASVVAGVLAVTALAVGDWLRGPRARSHLGDFVQQVLDGEAAQVVGRKAEANLDLLVRTPYGIVVPAALLFLVLVLLRPDRRGAPALQRAYRLAPTLRPGLVAVAVALLVGFAVNDSGIVIPAVGLALAIPLTLAASVTALLRDADAGDVPADAPPASGALPAGPPGATGPRPSATAG